MQEYQMLLLRPKTLQLKESYPDFVDYCLGYDFQTKYDLAFYEEWFEPLEKYDRLLYERFCERQDYRYKDHFHYIYNEMTKEISIMIINPYQITLKCDRISNVLVQTLKEANHCFRIFRHDKCYEEVVI